MAEFQGMFEDGSRIMPVPGPRRSCSYSSYRASDSGRAFIALPTA